MSSHVFAFTFLARRHQPTGFQWLRRGRESHGHVEELREGNAVLLLNCARRWPVPIGFATADKRVHEKREAVVGPSRGTCPTRQMDKVHRGTKWWRQRGSQKVDKRMRCWRLATVFSVLHRSVAGLGLGLVPAFIWPHQKHLLLERRPSSRSFSTRRRAKFPLPQPVMNAVLGSSPVRIRGGAARRGLALEVSAMNPKDSFISVATLSRSLLHLVVSNTTHIAIK
ncbi:unnamed protein product [Protopolystoma xenopodis]|uniref:Uncharacterized protein n=1 Tax=Protopolystoma xenopodis TaxID=117903 RepID=A0A3S5B9A4_9PLAT|nr:unnamed protein product [Protopolystoma xenopodis]